MESGTLGFWEGDYSEEGRWTDMADREEDYMNRTDTENIDDVWGGLYTELSTVHGM